MEETVLVTATTKRIHGTIHLPFSKSITNRAHIINALSGKVHISNASEAEDSLVLEQLLNQETGLFNVGHAGSPMRFLTAFFSITEGERILTGSERMKQRPVQDLAKALIALGADIRYLEKEGFLPLIIRGKRLRGGEITMDASISSQFISAMMMIAPYLEGGLTINLQGEKISAPYIRMTLKIMEKCGAIAEEAENKISIATGKYKPCEISVEPDWSAASYWYECTALSGNWEITLPGLERESLQGDSMVAGIFSNLGVDTQYKEGNIHLKKSENKMLKAFDFDCSECPDLAQTIAVTMAAKGIRGTLSGLSSLRIKETDRIEAICMELKKFGVPVVSGPDFIRIPASELQRPVSAIETYQDHRMAMAFAPLALVTGELKIKNPGVVKKSYPGFWKDMENTGFQIRKTT